MMQYFANSTCVRWSTANTYNQTRLRFIATNTGPNNGCYASFGRIYNATEQIQANGGPMCDPTGYGVVSVLFDETQIVTPVSADEIQTHDR